MVSDVVGLDGEILTDPSKPDGTPRKLMSADKLRGLGWSPSIELREGVEATYRWFLENVAG
jgi:GDP-L-fucose synthase